MHAIFAAAASSRLRTAASTVLNSSAAMHKRDLYIVSITADALRDLTDVR